MPPTGAVNNFTIFEVRRDTRCKLRQVIVWFQYCNPVWQALYNLDKSRRELKCGAVAPFVVFTGTEILCKRHGHHFETCAGSAMRNDAFPHLTKARTVNIQGYLCIRLLHHLYFIRGENRC